MYFLYFDKLQIIVFECVLFGYIWKTSICNLLSFLNMYLCGQEMFNQFTY